MIKQFFPAVALSLLASISIGACSTTEPSQKNAGQRISDRGSDISNRGESWNDGQRDQVTGQKMVDRSVDQVSDGERDLQKARAAVLKAERRLEVAHQNRTNGEALVANGTTKMVKAEADYAAIKSGPSAIPPK